MAENDHCWHKTGLNTGVDQDEVCCLCGLTYRPSMTISTEGHGKYSPDRVRPPHPSGPCGDRKSVV